MHRHMRTTTPADGARDSAPCRVTSSRQGPQAGNQDTMHPGKNRGESPEASRHSATSGQPAAVTSMHALSSHAPALVRPDTAWATARPLQAGEHRQGGRAFQEPPQGGRFQAREREEKTRAWPESAGRKEGGARGWGISSKVLTGTAATTTRGGARTGARTANNGMTCRTGASRSPMTAHSGQQSSMSERVNSDAGAAPSSSVTPVAWSGCPDTGWASCRADAWAAWSA